VIPSFAGDSPTLQACLTPEMTSFCYILVYCDIIHGVWGGIEVKALRY